jgi:hypothetical protein
MAQKRKVKQWTVKVKETSRKWLSVLLVIFLIAFLLRFEFVAELVSGVSGIPKEDIQDSAGSVAMITLGALLILTGAFISIPFVAPAMVVVGFVVIIVELVRIYNSRLTGGKIEGLDS